MPSGLRKTTGNHFEIYYEQPWGGVNSSVNPVDMQPNELETSIGIIVVDGELNALAVNAVVSNFKFNPASPGSVVVGIWAMNAVVYCLDNFGRIYSNQVPASGFVLKTTASDGPWPSIGVNSIQPAIRVVNGMAFISVFARNSIYTYDGNVSFTLGSNFSGGNVLGILNDQLLQLNVNQMSGGINPNMISWSGPGEFTTWNPALNRTAGFNQIASVDDQLTGFISLANVGIAVAGKTLVELSPTGVAIQPFNFTNLWLSQTGQGSIYPLSITQYGQLGFAATDSGVFSISTGAGFSDIAGKARTAIMSSFQPASFEFLGGVNLNVAGGILLYFLNSPDPTPFYVLAAPTIFGESSSNIVLWFYDISKNVWYSALFNPAVVCNTQNGTSIPNIGALVTSLAITTIQTVQTSTTSFGTPQIPITLIYYTISFQGVTSTVVAQLYAFNRTNALTIQQPPTVLSLTFRPEEIKLGRKPTIRRVLIKAYGSGTLNLTVSGVSFGSIVLNGVSIPATYESPFGMFTGEDPQLSITSNNFIGSIIKVMLAGTYAEGDID
jgi:hypothetical protein